MEEIKPGDHPLSDEGALGNAHSDLYDFIETRRAIAQLLRERKDKIDDEFRHKALVALENLFNENS